MTFKQERYFWYLWKRSAEAWQALTTLAAPTRAVIGSSRFHGYDPEQSEVEIGWSFLARSCWGGAYNGEMKRLMLEHAFRFVDFVVLLVARENLRSQRAVEKVGGVRSGWRNSGQEIACYLYRIDGRC